MLLTNSETFYKWLFWYVIFAMLYAGHTYLANKRLPADDPEKRFFPAILIVLAPITLPLSLLVSFLVLMMRALFYGLSLAAFTIGLLLSAVVNMARKGAAVYQK